MCTAVSVSLDEHYFGRNLDFEHGFGEKITITPANYPFVFSDGKVFNNHYSMIGMAVISDNYPLYFDAVNEKGVGMAGLNFPANAKYNPEIANKLNVASYELIPRLLCCVKSVNEAKEILLNANITNKSFSKDFNPTPLHWFISDKNESLTLEQTEEGLKVYDNPVGILTNNPTFDIQLFNLNNYLSASPSEPTNNFSKKITLEPYSRGMGGMGIPGDLSSMSRFVKAGFTKLNSCFGEKEEEIISQFFHILGSVYQQRGCVKVGDSYEITNYSSCCNTDRGIYYYTTYNNSRVNGIDMNKENLSGEKLITYELKTENEISINN